MPIDYHVIEGETGMSASDLEALYNNLGAQGWKVNQVLELQQNRRRVIFAQAGAVIEYHVVDYATGADTTSVEQTLDQLGLDDWMLAEIFPLKQDLRRAIMMRGPGVTGGGGGIPEAPTDGLQYGRQSAAWTQVVGGTG